MKFNIASMVTQKTKTQRMGLGLTTVADVWFPRQGSGGVSSPPIILPNVYKRCKKIKKWAKIGRASWLPTSSW